MQSSSYDVRTVKQNSQTNSQSYVAVYCCGDVVYVFVSMSIAVAMANLSEASCLLFDINVT